MITNVYCSAVVIISNSLDHSPSWKSDGCSANQEILSFYVLLSIHCCIYKIQPLDPILEHPNPTQSQRISLRYTYILILPSYMPQHTCGAEVKCAWSRISTYSYEQPLS
jgi:hypothetical protein